MRIIIIGGTGYIGQALTRNLYHAGHSPVVISRDKTRAEKIFGENIESYSWDGRSSSSLVPLLERADAVINLAGENIGQKRWTAKQKAKIIESRINLGKAVANGIKSCLHPPKTLIQASAIGYYGSQPGAWCTDVTPCGEGFIARMTEAWEMSVSEVKNQGVRLVYIRNGVILGPGGVFLTRLTWPFRFGFGVIPGHGKNWLSWIHIGDELAAIKLLLENPEMDGPFNMVSPSPVTLEHMVREAGIIRGRIWIFRVPAFILMFIYGEMARETIFASQQVVPGRLLENGFRFRLMELRDAMKSSFPSSGQ